MKWSEEGFKKILEASSRGSKTLQATWKRKRQEYSQSPSLCKVCSRPLAFEKRENKFCSTSCAAKFNNPNRKRSKIRSCIKCGSKLRKSQKKYCSRECEVVHKQETKIAAGKAGIVTLKSHLLYLNGNKCMNCGIDSWQDKPLVIELDHIDGNYLNNTLENCRLLCPNCHSQTPTYRAKNRGNGRHSRRQRYKENKSY